jgi:hypothetical protein
MGHRDLAGVAWLPWPTGNWRLASAVDALKVPPVLQLAGEAALPPRVADLGVELRRGRLDGGHVPAVPFRK